MPATPIEDAFLAFAPGGAMDASAFQTLCRRLDLYDGSSFSQSDATAIFESARTEDAAGKKSAFLLFEAFHSLALPALAEKTGMSHEDMQHLIIASAPSHASAAAAAEAAPAAGGGGGGGGSAGGLKEAFEAFASFGTGPQTEMDNAHFSKMCKEVGLISKKLTTTDVDLIFNKVKAKTARKLSFAQFKDGAVPEIATKLGSSPADVAARITASSPASSGTVAEATRFHDDKTQYTGVYKAGGPSSIDQTGLSGLVDRDVRNDARGVPVAKPAAAPAARPSVAPQTARVEAPAAVAQPPPQPATSRRPEPSAAAAAASTPAGLKEAFEAFASFGGGPQTEMDNAHFSKMCKEVGLVDKSFATTDVDLLFNKAKAKTARKLTFAQFKSAVVPEIATKKGMAEADVIALICSSSPASSGTVAEATRFHDDKTQFTGVHKAGGPSTIDQTGLSGLVDRDVKNDARGVPTGARRK